MQILKNKNYFLALVALIVLTFSFNVYGANLMGSLSFSNAIKQNMTNFNQGASDANTRGTSTFDTNVIDTLNRLNIDSNSAEILTKPAIRQALPTKPNLSVPPVSSEDTKTPVEVKAPSITTTSEPVALPGCKKPVPVTLPDGEKAFMLTVYAHINISPQDMLNNKKLFTGDNKSIDSILYFDKSEFQKYNASLNSVLTNTGFVQLLSNKIDFEKFGVLDKGLKMVPKFHPLFLFSKTADFGEFCQQFANSTYYEITDTSEHFDVLAIPKLDSENNAQISNIYNDDIFKYLGVEVKLSAMPSSYDVYRVKFRETKEDRCISSTGICVEPVIGEAAVNTQVPSTPIREIDTKFIDVQNMYEGAENELLATLQVGSVMTVSLSSDDKTVENQLAFFQGNKQIIPEKDGLYTLTAGDYDILNLDEVRLLELKDIDDFSITVTEFEGAFDLTENFRRNKMVLSFEDKSDDFNVSGILNFTFKSVTPDRTITFDDIKNQLRLQNTDSLAGGDGSTLEINDVNTKFQIFSDTTALFSILCCSFGGSIDLNKSNLSLLMDNALTFDLSLFGKIMTLPKGNPLEF